MLPQAATPMILRHFYHRGLLLPSSSCYYTASVKLANEFGWIAVSVSHPGGLDEIDSDRAGARGLTASGTGMILHCGRKLSAHPLGPRVTTLISHPSPPWIWELSRSCGEFSYLHRSAAWQAHGRGRSREDETGEGSRTPTRRDFVR